ncbi:MAG: cytochrome c family protein [Desulfarculus sp.]|nr:cytochrome c family protein [Desulfarculus sp.]
MKKSIIAILAVLAFVAAGLMAGAAWAEKTKSGEVQDSFKIDNTKTFGTLTKSPVEFTHKKHTDEHKVKCDQCHHVFKDKKNVWKEGDKVQKCAECHKSPKQNEGEMLSLYNAFHKNCRDCHKEAKKGPQKCDDCHPKK